MTPADNLRAFVQKELELRRQYSEGKLSFGDWLKHIRVSHDELLRLLTGEMDEGVTRLDVLTNKALTTYHVPAMCRRIVVQTYPEDSVCGFAETIDGDVQMPATVAGEWASGLHGFIGEGTDGSHPRAS